MAFTWLGGGGSQYSLDWGSGARFLAHYSDFHQEMSWNRLFSVTKRLAMNIFFAQNLSVAYDSANMHKYYTPRQGIWPLVPIPAPDPDI